LRADLLCSDASDVWRFNRRSRRVARGTGFANEPFIQLVPPFGVEAAPVNLGLRAPAPSFGLCRPSDQRIAGARFPSVSPPRPRTVRTQI
jgi:hypothetical protein